MTRTNNFDEKYQDVVAHFLQEVSRPSAFICTLMQQLKLLNLTHRQIDTSLNLPVKKWFTRQCS